MIQDDRYWIIIVLGLFFYLMINAIDRYIDNHLMRRQQQRQAAQQGFVVRRYKQSTTNQNMENSK